jgi:hypothetical protein
VKDKVVFHKQGKTNQTKKKNRGKNGGEKEKYPDDSFA